MTRLWQEQEELADFALTNCSGDRQSDLPSRSTSPRLRMCWKLRGQDGPFLLDHSSVQAVSILRSAAGVRPAAIKIDAAWEIVQCVLVH